MSINLVNYDKALMLEVVKNSFVDLTTEMFSSIGLSITAVESYKYEWDIVEELKEKIKNPEIRKSTTQLAYATSSLINNAITDKTKILDLVTAPDQAAVSIYNNLLSFIENVPFDEFEPPIGPNITAARNFNEYVYSIPNYPKLDPRRTGRVVRIGPKALINPTIIKYMIMNAGRFGFVFYGPLDPTIWYWRGDKLPVIDPITGLARNYFTPYETVSTFSRELLKLLPPDLIPQQVITQQPVLAQQNNPAVGPSSQQ